MEITLPLILKAPDGHTVAQITMGGAADGWGDRVCSLWLSGDLMNVRNIQGGQITDDPGDLNLDIGAGSTENPGSIVMNFDVGKATEVFDGRKNRMASFRQGKTPAQNTIRHQARTYLHGGAWVPEIFNPDGSVKSWRKL